jgi:sugar/nucleoside kinase (ribokinase family)
MISIEFVKRVWDKLKDAELIYTELFILKHRQDIVYLLAELGMKEGKIFGFNLPSFYFIETYLADIVKLIEYADVFFANAAEASFFGNLLDLPVINYFNYRMLIWI